jgi:hypothetical protein
MVAVVRRRVALLALAVLVATVLAAARAGGQPATTVTVPLVPGWNNVAYVGPTAPVPRVLASLGDTYRTVWEFDPRGQQFRAYDPRVPVASDLTELTGGRAFWVYLLQPNTLAYQAASAPPLMLLYPGLNNIAYVGQEVPLAEAFASVPGRVQGVWRWDAGLQRWQGAIPSAPQASEFTTMQPGRAYTVHASADGGAVVLQGPEINRPVPSAPVSARSCHSFQTRQPEVAELRAAFNRAGHGQTPSGDPSFALPALETAPDGDGNPTPGYIPPTLLKAIAWAETTWRHAGYEVPRGQTGRTVTSSSCAFGLMQVLTDMQIRDQPTARQTLIGTDYRHNLAAGARILAEKWNLAPAVTPVVRPRQPSALEDWYYAVWAYHCYGERCTQLGLHDNPDDPVHTWPRPAYNSPEQLASGGRFTRADYPYQELVYGLIQHPPRIDGQPVWRALPVKLPPQGTVSFPSPRPFDRPGMTLDPTLPGDP